MANRTGNRGSDEAGGAQILKFVLLMVVYGVFLTVIARSIMRDGGGGVGLAGASESEQVGSEQETPELAAAAPPAVVIDAGHGGKDGGTVHNGMIEKTGVLAIALMLRDELEQRGVPVVLTREDDVTLDLMERSAIANEAERLLLVSVHLNAGPEGVEGVETFFSEPKSLSAQRAVRMGVRAMPGDRVADGRGALLAADVQEAICAATGARNRGTKNRPSLSVTRHTHCPAVLVECGFLSHPREAARLKTRAYQMQLARGIANGIEAYLETSSSDPLYGLALERPGAAVGTGALSAER